MKINKDSIEFKNLKEAVTRNKLKTKAVSIDSMVEKLKKLEIKLSKTTQ